MADRVPPTLKPPHCFLAGIPSGISAQTSPVASPQVFQGNFDNDTHRKNVIEPPIYARHVRILPWSWYGRITLRSELLGCAAED